MITENYTNSEYSVYTEPQDDNFRGYEVKKGDINVYKRDKDTPETMRPFATIEDAIAFADKKKAELEERRATRAAEKAETKEATATTATSTPLATDKQVKFIMRLLDQTDGGQGSWYNGPTTLDGVRSMTKSNASTYISALLGQ